MASVFLQIVLVLSCLAGLASVTSADSATYTDRFDSIDVEQIINNRRILLPYVQCILDKIKCTGEGQLLKDHLTDALQTGCSRCTQKQRQAAQTVITHLILHEKELWHQLTDKYNTSNSFVAQYETDAQAIN